MSSAQTMLDIQEEPQADIPSRWHIVIFMVNGKANHVGLSIPNYGLADLSLRGARKISWDGSSLPKGERHFFEIKISSPSDALEFLQRPCAHIGDYKARKGM